MSGLAPDDAEIDELALAAERERLQADAVGGSLWTSIHTIVGLPLALVANAIVAHSLGAEAYGTLAIYTAVYGIVVALLNAGVSDASVQWIATHKARAEPSIVADTIRRCSGYHIFIEAPLVALLAAFILRDAGVTAMVLAAVSAGAVMVVGTSTVVMSGSGLNALAARIAIVVTLATQTTVIAVASASPMPSSIFAGRIAVSLLGPVIAFFLIPSEARAAVLRPLFPRHWPPGFLAFALRTSASAFVSTLVFGRSELFVFQAYDLHEQAGLFALSAGIASVITAPVDSLLGPLLPATAGLLATAPDRAGRALLRGLRTSAVLAGLVAAVGIPFVVPLVPVIYGPSFSAAVGPFIALAVVSCIQSVNHPITAFLMAGRRTDLLLRTSAICVVLDLGIAVATIPLIGVAGAVIASSVAQLTVLAVIAVYVGRLVDTPLRAEVRAVSYFWDALVIGLVALGAELAIQDAPPGVRAVVGLLVALLGVAMVGRLRRSSGLMPDDASAIERGLPAPARAMFRRLVRVFALQSTTASS